MIRKIVLLLGLYLMAGYSVAEPLGIRTNNPGNLIKTTITWRGEVPCESRFECFKEPRYGIRALALNLLNYQRKYNLQTVDEIIHRWSPPSENRTSLLVDVVSKRLGIDRYRELDLENPLILRELMIAIIIQENGYNPYKDNLLREITNGLTNSNGNPDYGRRGLAGRVNEIVGDEATDMVGTTEDGIRGSGEGPKRTRTNQTEYQSALSVDTKGDCTDLRILGYPFAQTGSGSCARDSSHYWVDRVESRIPILRGIRGNGLAYCEGVDPNPSRYPRGQPDPWPILWWFTGGS